jgi:signal transduction histidine kinase
MVQAADAERKRLERNLHDGAQQRLVSLALLLQLAERQLASDPQAAQLRLIAARAELSHALAQLRELARGLHPAVLTDRGLGVALEALAARAPVPVELSVELEDRLADTVQAAAYYVVSEALTNVAKYAHATAARVSVQRAGPDLVITIADDGIGGANQADGSGLRGLNDRIEAVGGQLDLDSPPAAGTTLRARIPCQPT